MPHANAALTPRHRLMVARDLAGESMNDRSSRPKTSPKKMGPAVTKRCVSLRMRLRERPVQLAARLGNIPDGGGWRYVGRRQGERNRAATPDKPKSKWHNPKLGYAFVRTVIDDHSCVAYTEVHDDETAVTAVAVLHRAVDWLADRGVTIERVLSNNGEAYPVTPMA
ncbi:IS481 family transposase ISPfr21 [Austwickia sp. TVS 96-490-7B]|nr:IS481 family transposase ISPfr21 [Austwickia sp. TVS 96-490-7B]